MAGIERDTTRLFPDSSVQALLEEGARSDVIALLLEEGDTEDLRWLAGHFSRSEIADWVKRYGGRGLSRRSRLFWAAVLGVESSEPHPLASELWPL